MKKEDWDGNIINTTFFDAVGVDEYHPSTGLNEAEKIYTGLKGAGGERLTGPGLANTPPHMVLSPMNYGNVWMQGLDMGLTQLIPEYDLIIDGNISWYGTTEFYNILTKKNDPINAPKYKINTTMTYMPTSSMNLNISMRHIPEFDWASGVHFGTIHSYIVMDVGIGYNFDSPYDLLLNVSNINNDDHN